MNFKDSIMALNELAERKNLGYITSEAYLYVLCSELCKYNKDENDKGYSVIKYKLGEYIDSIEKSAWGARAISEEMARVIKLPSDASIEEALRIISSKGGSTFGREIAKECLSSEQIRNDIMALEKMNSTYGKEKEPKSPLLTCLNNYEPKIPLIGRERELERTIEVLSRMLKSNPLHVGPPGVGKTSIVEALAQRIKKGEVPEQLQGKKIYSLDIGNAMAGASFRGELEGRIKSALEEIPEGSIVYIDEIHNLIGTGKGTDGGIDIANMIKPYLTSGEIRFIGATTSEEYKRYIEKDAAFSRRFQKIDVDEPSVEDTVKILFEIAPRLEEYHNVKYTSDALEKAVRLSAYHIHDKYLPDKAIDLIDEAGAICELRKSKTVDSADVEDVLCKICHISPEHIKESTEKNSYSLIHLNDSLKSQVYGQDEAIEAVAEKIKLSKSGFKFDDGPIAKFLFVGPTGCGKTELAKSLSNALKMKLLRYDMAEYSEEHSVSKLFGSPAGYVGYDDGGLLVNAVRDNPNSIVLFDEIEKAHPKIYSSLLGMMDYGLMTDTKGKKADFRNAIVIFTSNAGARESQKKGLGFGKSSSYIDTSSIDEAVKRTFSPEFIGRLSSIVNFNSINEQTALLIVQKELSQIVKVLESKGVKLKTSPGVLRQISRVGISPEHGAREVKNIVQKNISRLFVDELLNGKIAHGDTVTLKYSEGKQEFYIRNSDKSKNAV